MVKGHLTKYQIYCMYIFEPADLVTFSEDCKGSIVTQASWSRVSCRRALTLLLEAVESLRKQSAVKLTAAWFPVGLPVSSQQLHLYGPH